MSESKKARVSMTHEQSRERMRKFAEFAARKDIQEKMSDLKKTKRMGFLRQEFEKEFGQPIPAVSAYRALKTLENEPESPVQDELEKTEWVLE